MDAPGGPPAVGAVFPFARLPDALKLLNSGTTVGKVVVEVGDDTEALWIIYMVSKNSSTRLSFIRSPKNAFKVVPIKDIITQH